MIQPTEDRVLVQPHARETKSTTGLHLVFDKDNREAVQRSTVLALGPGRTQTDRGLREPSVKPGDVVLHERYAGAELQDGTVILNAEEVLAVLESEE